MSRRSSNADVLRATVEEIPQTAAILEVMKTSPAYFEETLKAFADAGKQNGADGVFVARVFIAEVRTFADRLAAICAAAEQSLNNVDPQS